MGTAEKRPCIMSVVEVNSLTLTFYKLITSYGGIEATIKAIEAEMDIKYEPPKPKFIYGNNRYEREKLRALKLAQ